MMHIRSSNIMVIKLSYGPVRYEAMEFALDNTLIKDMDGHLRQQTCGIPMGDPHSSGMAIRTCAWMENLWMQTIDSDSKKFFKAKRYMDDILTFYVTNPRFNHTKLLTEFKQSQCTRIRIACLNSMFVGEGFIFMLVNYNLYYDFPLSPCNELFSIDPLTLDVKSNISSASEGGTIDLRRLPDAGRAMTAFCIQHSDGAFIWRWH